MEALRFPRGVRLALAGDLPRGAADALERIANAKIAAGFVLTTCADAGYSTYIEANIHADEVWAVFEALSGSLLPRIAAPIIGWKDAEPTLGPYTDKSAAISVLRPHKESLQHDGFIEFGLIFQSEGRTEEIFVKASKHMQIWTNRPEAAEATLLSMKVTSVEKLQFIDEFPRVTERLADAPPSSEIIAAIVESFQRLLPP